MSCVRLRALHTNSLQAEFPQTPFHANQAPLPALPCSPKLLCPRFSCPVPHSPRIPEALPNSGARQTARPEPLRGNQTSSGIRKGNNPMQRVCYAPKPSPVEQSSDTAEPQPHHTRCENVPNVTCEPKPAPLIPRGFQPLNPFTPQRLGPQMLFPSIPAGTHTITAAPSFAMDF